MQKGRGEESSMTTAHAKEQAIPGGKKVVRTDGRGMSLQQI